MGGLSLRVGALFFCFFLGIGIVAVAGVSPSRADRFGDDGPPVADAGRDAVSRVGDVVVLDGSGSTDPENDGLTYSWRLVERPVGSAAALSDIATVRPAVTVDADGRFVFELVVSNEDAASIPDYVEVNTGDVAPAADAGADLSVSAGTVATLDGAGSSDAGGDRLSYQWRLASKPDGSAAVLSDAGAIRPTLPIDLAGDYVAELTVGDGVATGIADRVLLSTGRIAPAAHAGADQPARPYEPLVLDAELTGDADGDILSFHWSVLSGVPGAETELARPHARRAAFVFSEAGDFVLQLTATDADGEVTRDTVVVSSGNTRPVADAGPDLAIAPGDALRLDGTSSTDLDGDRLAYRWALLAAPAGSAASLADDSSVRPWFEPDVEGGYVLQLTVGDGTEWSTPDTVVLTTGNLPPVAEAGPDRWMAKPGAVALDGLTSTDGNGDGLSYRWALLDGPRGSRAVLGDVTSAEIGFTADRRGTYVAQLVVNDGVADSAPSLVVIGVGKGAWGDEKESDYDDLLDRDDDDRDNDRGDKSNDDKHAALDGARLVPAAYIPEAQGSNGKGHDDGQNDGKGHEEHGEGKGLGHDEDDGGEDDDRKGGKLAGFSGHPGDVNIRPVAAPAAAPRVAQGSQVQLDGGNSTDANGDALTYRWALIAAPEGSAAELDDAASITPSFTADLPGFYVAQLVVFDGLMRSFPRTVAVQVNTPPIADAGPDQELDTGGTVLLDGSGSYDPDGDPLSYAWSVASAPVGSIAEIADATAEVASFTPGIDGVYEIQLVVNDGIENSAPDIAVITVFSNPPVAEAGDDQIITVGSLATLDGTASFDPDGQAITWRWRFTARPKDSAAVVDDASAATPSFTADKEGLYVLDLVVSDGRLESQPDVVAVRAWSGIANSAPVFDVAVGDRTVFLGEALNLTLNATDPDGDAVYYFATPLPLPDNMTLDATTGAFSFRPDAQQVGGVTITLGASDGIARASETVTITVMTPPPGTPTSIAGRVLDAAANDQGEIFPVAGATVRLVETGQIANTDADGNFFIGNIPFANAELRLDISRPGYQAVRYDVSLIANTVNVPDPFYMAPINPTVTKSYGVSQFFNGLVITDPTTGVTLNLGRAFREGTFAYSGTFSMFQAPSSLVESLAPAWITPCQVVAISFSEARVINFSATIAMPNRDNLAPGSEVDIWNLNPTTRKFQIVRIGRVNADGTKVGGSIVWPTMFFAAPPAPLAMASADMNRTSLTPTLLADGNVSQAITLPGYSSLGRNRAETLIYNSASADPRPIIAMDTTILARTGVPATIEGWLEVGGVAVAGPFATDTQRPAPLPEDVDATIRNTVNFDAGELETGIHPYRFTATANYGCSKVSADVTGELPVNNQSDSPFGAGWTLAGLERLHIKEDGDILLTEGDGSAKAFDSTRQHFLPPVGIPAAGPGAGALDDFNGDGNLDMAIPAMVTGELVVLLGDGAGAFPQDRRFIAGEPQRIDPVDSRFKPDTHAVATGDFNNDGIRDLLVNNQWGNRIRVYLGNGDGSFQTPRLISQGRPQGIAVADFNGDGNDDFVVATSAGVIIGGHRISVYYGDGAGNFPASRSFLPQFGFVSSFNHINVAVADYDNNGSPDIAVASDTRDGADLRSSNIHMMLNDGTGNFPVITRTATEPIEFRSGRFPLAAADFNSDGNTDLAMTIKDANHLTIFFGNGIGGFFKQLRVPTGIGAANSLTATDYDRDGDIDVVASGRFTGTIVLFESDRAGGLQIEETVPVGGNILFSVRAGDFNNDGAPDLQTGNETAIHVLLADLGKARRFRSPGADFSSLERADTGGYIRRMTDGTTIEYNADGLMTARVDANGNRTDYGYDAGGRLASVSDPADPGRSTVFDYTGDGLGSITDVAGRTTFFQVDADGNMVSFADAESNVSRYAYDSGSKLSAFASARGFVTSFDYGFAGQYLGAGNPDGTSVTASVTKSLGLPESPTGTGEWIAPEDRVAELQDAKGNLYTIEVNEYGHVIRSTDPLGRETVIERDADNLVRRTSAPTDNDASGTVVTELDYDENGNVTAKTEAAGTALARITRFEYEPVFNRVRRVTDPAGGETVNTYDDGGNLLTVTDAAGGVQSFTYDARGLRVTATDANGNVTRFAYDFFGNIRNTVNGAGEETRMARDTAGQVTGVTEGFGSAAERTTAFVFDDLGRITSETDPTGAVTETVFDADGNTIEEIDATGIASTSEYDVMGRLAAESHPATGTVSRLYDENGNLATMIDPTGNIAHFQYDAMNRAVRTEDPAGGVRLFAYDSQDNPVEVVDANGNATAFTYDPLGREIERRNAPGDVWTFVYDSRDNMVETADAKNQRVEKAFDALNRMIRVTTFRDDGSQEDVQSFAYDPQGQKIAANDNDSALAWTYDAANRVATAETIAGLTNAQPAVILTHDYDAAGNRTSLSDSAGGTTWFSHDGAGRLTRVTTASNDTIDLGYDAAGRLTRIANPNAVATEVSYDPATGRPQSIAHAQGSALLAGFGYGFDTDGKIATIADGGGTRNFTYDRTQQVKTGGYATAPESYSYDKEGNRTLSHLSASYTHDAANRLREDADTCYAYDANGNMTSKRVKTGLDCVTDATGATTTYTWDVLNRLTRIDNPDATWAAYRYDAQGRRIEKDINNLSLTRYVYDDDAILLEYDGANALQATYSHGEEVDQPLAMTRSVDSWFYHTDHLGSIRLLTNAAGAIANRYDYDAFGNLEATSFEGVANPYAFTARERDAESGLMFYRARYYDPKVGRFISEDPIGFEAGDNNLYRYTFNQPIHYKDPSGLDVAGTAVLSKQAAVIAGGGVFLALAAALQVNIIENAARLKVIIGDKSVGTKFNSGRYDCLFQQQVLLEAKKIHLNLRIIGRYKSWPSWVSLVREVNQRIHAHNARCPKLFFVFPMVI